MWGGHLQQHLQVTVRRPQPLQLRQLQLAVGFRPYHASGLPRHWCKVAGILALQSAWAQQEASSAEQPMHFGGA
jgi:hypothetical protein